MPHGLTPSGRAMLARCGLYLNEKTPIGEASGVGDALDGATQEPKFICENGARSLSSLNIVEHDVRFDVRCLVIQRRT